MKPNWTDVKKYLVKVVNQGDVIYEAFKISLKHKHTVYDSMHIALAKKMKLELVTSDKRQRDVAMKGILK